MLSDRALMRKAARKIVREAMQGEDGDATGHLNALDVMFFKHGGLHIFVPVADEVHCRRALLFMADQIPGLIASMDRLPDPRAKSLIAHSTLTRWSQSFKRMCKRIQRLD